MMTEQLIPTCPYCGRELATTPPDNWHLEHSLVEPTINHIKSDFKKRQVVCKNPECKREVTVYWYAPIEYFSLM